MRTLMDWGDNLPNLYSCRPENDCETDKPLGLYTTRSRDLAKLRNLAPIWPYNMGHEKPKPRSRASCCAFGKAN